MEAVVDKVEEEAEAIMVEGEEGITVVLLLIIKTVDSHNSLRW